MPGISSGRYDPSNITLGRGRLYFSTHSADGVPVEYRDLGNVVSMTASMESSDLDHFNTRGGVKFTDGSVFIQQKHSLSFELDEISLDNIALWFSGTTGIGTGYNGVLIAAGDNGVNTGTPTLGRWYDLYKTITGPPTINPQGDRVYDLGVVSVTSTPTGVEGVNYLIDYKMGRIFFIKNTATPITTFTTLSVAANGVADATYEEARLFTGQALKGSLKLVQINPRNSNEMREWQWHSVQLMPSGSMDLIGDDWSSMEFNGTASQSTEGSTTSPSCTVRTFKKATNSSVPD